MECYFGIWCDTVERPSHGGGRWFDSSSAHYPSANTINRSARLIVAARYGRRRGRATVRAPLRRLGRGRRAEKGLPVPRGREQASSARRSQSSVAQTARSAVCDRAHRGRSVSPNGQYSKRRRTNRPDESRARRPDSQRCSSASLQSCSVRPQSRRTCS